MCAICLYKIITIKRIQQTTHTYIVTPSREKDPVFEVTVSGTLPDMLEGLLAMAKDSTKNSVIDVGSLLINAMTVAGH